MNESTMEFKFPISQAETLYIESHTSTNKVEIRIHRDGDFVFKREILYSRAYQIADALNDAARFSRISGVNS